MIQSMRHTVGVNDLGLCRNYVNLNFTNGISLARDSHGFFQGYF